MTAHLENLLVGQFCLGVREEYTLGLIISEDLKMKVVLCGNKY